MSKENTTFNLIQQELEEKTAQFQGLANKVQQARKFVQENEPNLLALDGAVQQLRLLKEKLTAVPETKLEEKKPEEEINKS